MKLLKRLFACLFSFLLLSVFLSGCLNGQKSESTSTGTEKTGNTEVSTKKTEKETAKETNATKLTSGTAINTNFRPEFTLSGESYAPLDISPNAPVYTLNSDLSNIENISQFSNLTQKQRDMIAKNGFVVIPSDSEQLFYIYEDNAYKKLPGFVTADSVLQLYHILYDYSLRNVETDFFYPDLITLNENMMSKLIDFMSQTKDEELKHDIAVAAGYFAVANLTLGKDISEGLPDDIKKAVLEEEKLINEASDFMISPLLGAEVDYSLFKVRGHYTRSEELGKYFQAMSWYGVVPINFFDTKNTPDKASARKAILMTMALCSLSPEDGVELWENIYSTSSYFVGESDNLTPYEISLVIEQAYGGMPAIDDIPKGMDAFYQELETVRKARIVNVKDGQGEGLQMRFMGQRYIPDSEILQNLSVPRLRPFPSGLDIFAVFGSPRAKELLDEFYQPQKKWAEYEKNFKILYEKFQSQSIAEQTDNLYKGWLYCLKALGNRLPEGYPLFMRNTAWEDKSLSSALGSWAEIRHDTILYGKQSAVECGGDEPPEVIGYVEPNPEFFNRLLWLCKNTRENLTARGLINEGMQHNYENFENMLIFLRDCAIKELHGEDLSFEEYRSILTFGGTLEYLSSSIAESDNWYMIESNTDKNMALIADIHTATDQTPQYLEVGVGHAAEIYVAVLQGNKVYLTRGAVFDFFEFTSEERLTDERWQELLKQSPPERPPFIESYMDPVLGNEVPTPDSPYTSGC